MVGAYEDVLIENEQSVSTFINLVAYLYGFIIELIDEEIAFGVAMGGAGEVVVIDGSNSLEINIVVIVILYKSAVGFLVTRGYFFGL